MRFVRIHINEIWLYIFFYPGYVPSVVKTIFSKHRVNIYSYWTVFVIWYEYVIMCENIMI